MNFTLKMNLNQVLVKIGTFHTTSIISQNTTQSAVIIVSCVGVICSCILCLLCTICFNENNLIVVVSVVA